MDDICEHLGFSRLLQIRQVDPSGKRGEFTRFLMARHRATVVDGIRDADFAQGVNENALELDADPQAVAVAAQAEQRETQSIAALHAGLRKSAGRPSWMEKRPVPGAPSRDVRLPSGRQATPTPCVSARGSLALPMRESAPASAVCARSPVHAGREPSARSERPTTRSGWGNLWDKAAAVPDRTPRPAFTLQAESAPSADKNLVDEALAAAPLFKHVAVERHEASNRIPAPPQSRFVSRRATIPTDGSYASEAASPSTAWETSVTCAPRPPLEARPQRSAPRPRSAAGRRNSQAAGLAGDADVIPSSALRQRHRKVGHPKPARDGSTKVAELSALRQVCLAEDEAILQQLRPDSAAGRRSRGVAKSAPAVPRPSEVPPSLRAWRRHRQLEGVAPGAGQEEQRLQVARMKSNLQALQGEIRQLQDIMEEDAMELVDNVRTIQAEMRARRMRSEGCSTACPSSIATSTTTSAAPSAGPASPRSGLVSHVAGTPAPLSPGEIRNAMLRACAVASEQAGQSQPSSRAVSRRSVIVSMRPLTVWMMHNLGNVSAGVTENQLGFAKVMTLLPQSARCCVEFLVGASCLALGCVCRSAAVALHSRVGQRIWPHVELDVTECQPAEVVRPFRSAVCVESVQSIAVYGARDEQVHGWLDLVCSATGQLALPQHGARASHPTCAGVNGPAIKSLRLSCGNKGSAGAVEMRNRFGDRMGIGVNGFTALLSRVQDPSLASIQTLDASWNHLCDGAMESLRAGWPQSLTALRLCWNFITSDGATQLAVALTRQEAARLRSLDLRSNPLGDSGVVAICEAVAQRTCLQSLGLGETSMTDEGACAALAHLKYHPSLTMLDIGENVLTDSACQAVADVIDTAPSITTLLLRGFLFETQRITDVGGKVLVAAVARRGRACLGAVRGKFDLELDYQQVGCSTASELARNCEAWSRLSLLNTEVSTMGAMALANAFRQLPVEAAARARLNVAQCRIAPGAVQLLRAAGFARLDSHGQRAFRTAT